MGYSGIAYDPSDLWTIYNILNELKEGKSIPGAFYNAHKNDDALHNRWIMYLREGENIIEYSERSGNNYNGN
jgi:hypothetical protein